MSAVGEARAVRRHRAPFGRALEDFVVGDVFEHWPGRTVTEGEHQLFCALTGNMNPIHVDRAAAAGDPVFGRVVVAGTFVYSLLAGMGCADVSGSAIANLGIERLEHLAPLSPGDTLYAESEVLARRPSATEPDRGVVSLETRGFRHDGELVCRFTRTLLVWRRDFLLPRFVPAGTSEGPLRAE